MIGLGVQLVWRTPFSIPGTPAVAQGKDTIIWSVLAFHPVILRVVACIS